ncbi:CocE/NonD family hydrolase [Amycolatopsis sp. H20-H5]|uniref:CocE/NonD family hydrolase n=1 Tax=Amycolatopsis sp. H20-H5 TaxID=3046309 RepID=UPI002DBA3684|nr:CocE/NonD family hydrolase [Amycolatopsis sp. H20-H5]MEC3977465.1 CocE/NonD family hydrolase [Amycolatopsis sp. H20-H5]
MGGRRQLFSRILSGALIASAVLAPAAGAAPPAFTLRDGVTQPVYSYEHALRETTWVETGQDLDRDGRVDRVAADIIRPAEPAARGQRIPVIMDTSPYFACCGRGNEQQKKTYAPDGTPAQFPLFYDNYFVPRGYAVVLVDVGGTNRSSGCFDDVASGVGVVNWLNGRAKGFTTPEGTGEVKARWASGAVGAIGKSQDGAAAIGMASTGVDGLRTVVPIAGVSSYYEVHNSGGAYFGYGGGGPGLYNERAQVLCQPFEDGNARRAGTDGNYNPYWQSQNYVDKVANVRASVFDVQGFHDVNVNPLQFGQWWDALNRTAVARKAWLHQGAHLDPFDLQRPEFVSALHRWFDRWLLGVRNGIEREPAIHVEHTPDRWADEPSWPPAGTRQETFRPAAGPTPGLGALATGPGRGSASLTDTPGSGEDTWVLNPELPSPERVLFRTAPTPADTRIAGTGSVTVTVRSDQPKATVSAVLVDYGPATVRDTTFPALGVKNLTTRSCWGASGAADSACFLDTAADLVDVDHQILAAGWADIGHHRSLWRGEPLTPGKPYTLTLRLSTLDHVVPAGHRIALVLGGTDVPSFDPALPNTRPRLTFDLAGTAVSLPVVHW